jgi:hypothetical protein
VWEIGSVLKERVNHGIALSSRDEVDRKKRRAADTIHFLFAMNTQFRKDFLSERCAIFIREIALKKSEEISSILHRERLLVHLEIHSKPS